jgi:hypothetical protein
MPVTPTLGRQRQEDCELYSEFQASLSYIARPFSKKKEMG